MQTIKLTQHQIESWVAKNFEYKSRKNGEELLINNPFVPGDFKFKFNISTVLKKSKSSGVENYWVHDWRPSAKQYSGSFLKFVQRYKGCTFKEAVKDVCGDGVDLKSFLRPKQAKRSEPEQQVQRLELPINATPINDNKNPMFRSLALNYLEYRGIQYNDAVSFRLHYTPTMVVFPYLEYDEIVYWQARSASSSVKEFTFPDQRKVGIGKTDYIYGFDNAEPNQPVYITEAIFDALTIGPGGLASGGAKLAENQKRKIKAINPSMVVLAPDNDKEGLASIYENWTMLNPYFDIYYILPPKTKDWNEIVKQATNKTEALSDIRKYINQNMEKLTMSKAIKFRMTAQG